MRPFGSRPTVRLSLATLALFVVLAVVHTWPLASAPGTLSRNDTGDTVLHEWTLAWVAHQIVRDPIHLFDANIFYPERRTLAYSDHLLVQAMMAAPLLWAGASPVLAYNLLLIAGLALTGWTTSLVIHRWTGSWLAGILSGCLTAFNALTLTRLPQIQDQHFEFFPLALLALDRLLAEPRVKHALALAGWFSLHALTCGYLLAFGFISLVAAFLARPEEWRGKRIRPLIRPALAAAAVTAVVVTPFLVPYLIVNRTQGLERPLEEVTRYSAQLTDYLATGGRLHYALWSRQFFRGDALFPGIVGFGLAIVAIITGVADRDRRARMALVFGIVAFLMSFGTAFPGYRLLYYGFPVMKGIRGAVRFGQFSLAAVAVLAGFGLAALQRPMRRGAFALGLILVVVANAEALRSPLVYREYQGIPAVYDNLKNAGEAVVACFPFYGRGAVQANVPYMLASTRFWKPLLNGYSGFSPPSFYRHLDALAGFPDRTSIDYLRGVGVTHVVVDGSLLSQPRIEKLPNFVELQLWVTDGTIRIYRLQ